MANPVVVRSPSNIALIKYMGKTDSQKNLPENASLSMTLNSLCSVAEASRSNRDQILDRLPEAELPLVDSRLSEKGEARVLRFIQSVKTLLPSVFPDLSFDHTSGVEVACASTFPQGVGIASSASAFSAITTSVALALCEERQTFVDRFRDSRGFRTQLAEISRTGSGSSIRSFDGPWVEWEGETIHPVEVPQLEDLCDIVVLVSSSHKKVGSSEAHRRVRESGLWSGRQKILPARTTAFKKALTQADWPMLKRIAWSEFWEMHSLFHTASEPFTYMQPKSFEILQWYSDEVIETSRKIMLTMDAGPNVHLLAPMSECEAIEKEMSKRFGLEVLSDRSSSGTEVLSH